MLSGLVPIASLLTATSPIKSAPTARRYWHTIIRFLSTWRRRTALDPHCPNGAAIPIEQRAASEVTGVAGSFGSVQWAPEQARVHNPAFDVTPAALISGWVLDTGVITPEQVNAGIFLPR